MKRTNRTIATAGIAILSSLSLLGCSANSSEEPGQAQPKQQEQEVTNKGGSEQSIPKADVDGDGRSDPVQLKPVSDKSMLLRVGLADQSVDIKVEGNANGQSVRPVDVNGDEQDEVMVPVSVGANTVTYTVWGFGDDGLYQINTEEGKPWEIAEGGGATAVNSFGCDPANSQRELITVNAVEKTKGTELVYEGERMRFKVTDGTARVLKNEQVQAKENDDPKLKVDKSSCDPLP